VYDSLATMFSPLQIMIVLLIALIIFGPKRLPDLGKQIGSALRDLNKAKDDVMRSMSLTHEPDPEPYKYSGYTNDYSTTYNTYTPEPDLTDYTISGQAVTTNRLEGTVAHDPSNEVDLDAYNISDAGSTAEIPSAEHSESGAPKATADADSEAHKGERHA
jgi:sec-independent protein translocase protein TatA